MYPTDDNKFQDVRVKAVANGGIERDDGFHFAIPKDCPIDPAPGMMARFYGDGIGRPVRGLFLDGQKVFYRTESEEELHFNQQLYGADCVEWLRRWDDGRGVWSVEMSGLGPGYEQCIQITAAEVLRHLLSAKADPASWDDETKWKADREAIDAAVMRLPVIEQLGLSGAQWGAACSLAIVLYRRGPVDALTDPAVKNRKIQVSKEFPRGVLQ